MRNCYLFVNVPAAIGVDNSEFEANLQSHQRRMQNDAFSITFTQFYQLLIHVAEVVYPELCDSKLEKEVSLEELKRGRTIALNKFILVRFLIGAVVVVVV